MIIGVEFVSVGKGRRMIEKKRKTTAKTKGGK